MAEEELELAEDETGGGSKKKLFIIIGIVVVLLLGGGGAAFFLMGGEDTATEESEKASTPEKLPASYISLNPSFTVNLSGDSKAKFLQISIDVMYRDPEIGTAITTHMPAIRNELVLMFSGKQSQELSTPEGKNALQDEVLKLVQKIIKDLAELEGVEAVYFTSFVMQ